MQSDVILRDSGAVIEGKETLVTGDLKVRYKVICDELSVSGRDLHLSILLEDIDELSNKIDNVAARLQKLIDQTSYFIQARQGGKFGGVLEAENLKVGKNCDLPGITKADTIVADSLNLRGLDLGAWTKKISRKLEQLESRL